MSLSTTIAPPEPDEYHEYYETYISKADSNNFYQAFEEQPQELRQLLGRT